MKFVVLIGLAGAAFAQVGGPRLGLVPDGAKIRAMDGLAAAGAVGGAIAAGFSNIAVAQDFALATDANGAAVLISGSGAVTPIADAEANAARIAISPSGSAAALWYPANSHFEIVTGLPAAPASARRIDATSFGALLAFAVSDNGHLAVSFTGGVEMFGTDSSVTPVPVNARVTAMAFFAGNTDLALAAMNGVIDVSGAKVETLYTFSAAARELAFGRTPAGIAVSSDGKWIAAARRDGTVVTIAIADGTDSRFDCECAPSGVFAIGGAVFRLTDTLPNGAVKLIDAGAASFLDVPPASGGFE